MAPAAAGREGPGPFGAHGTAMTHRTPQPATSVVVAGFDIRRSLGRDELGHRYRAREQSTRSTRTLRVVDLPLSSWQRDDLEGLWRGLLRRRLHPLLPTVVAYGTTEEGAPWVATDERVDEPLSALLADNRRPRLDEVIDLGSQAAGALRALHRSDLVHGGICPAAFVTDGVEWHLTDIGIGAIALPVPPQDMASEAGEILAHAAPEVLAGRRLTPAADIYSVGATLAEALTGHPLIPWKAGDTPSGLLRRHVSETATVPDDVAPAPVVDAIRVACRSEANQRPSARMLEDMFSAAGTSATPSEEPVSGILDEDVRFTVYRPDVVRPGTWTTMLVFAHKTTVGDPQSEFFDPAKEVERQAKGVLGPLLPRYQGVSEDSGSTLKRGSEVTFVPEIEGVEFDPPYKAFRWSQAVHQEEFQLRADPSLDGHRARGRLSVFVGMLLVAEVNLVIRIASSLSDDPPDLKPQEQAPPYHKIFVSYSHRDHAIVRQMESVVSALGHEFMRDSTHLRSGEVWNDRLMELIKEADVFQLFWSTNSMRSAFVRQEWEYALSLKRSSFLRPCYWEEPFPTDPDENLPPEELQQIHFKHLSFAFVGAPSTTAPSTVSAPVATTISPLPPPAAPPPAPPPPAWASPSATPASAPTTPTTPRSSRFSAVAAAGLCSVAVLLATLIGAVSLSRGGGGDVALRTEPPPQDVPVQAPPSGRAPPVVESTRRGSGTSVPRTTVPPTVQATPPPTAANPPTTTRPPVQASPPAPVITTVPASPTVPQIVYARSDPGAMCVRGKTPDTARVSVAVRHAHLLTAVQLVSSHAGVRSVSTMAPRPAGETVSGVPTGPELTVFVGTLGPVDTPGLLTWSVRAQPRAGEPLQYTGINISVDPC